MMKLLSLVPPALLAVASSALLLPLASASTAEDAVDAERTGGGGPRRLRRPDSRHLVLVAEKEANRDDSIPVVSDSVVVRALVRSRRARGRRSCAHG